VRIAVTTPLRPSAAEEAEAREAAARHGLRFAARGKRPLPALLAEAAAEGFLVLSRAQAVLWTPEEEHRWAGGMGLVRLKRVLARQAGAAVDPTARDPMLEAAEIGPGDGFLDATLGLGADALVAAAACGPAGRVVALEASAPLAAWVAEGLRRLPAEPARRIEVRAGDHAALLAALPPASFDVVLFDPMFRHGRDAPGGFDLLRRLADPRPLEAAAVAAARRVARRWVVVKDGAPGWDLARLGLTPLPSARGAHRYYGRLPPLPAASD
jgi:16S rRNA (guanine1516-N2)-methyltransferase